MREKMTARTEYTEEKRKKEQLVVEEMIRLYCRKHHDGYDRKTGRMCPACRQLSDYARLRSEKCPFMLSAAAAGCTAISRRCVRRSGR